MAVEKKIIVQCIAKNVLQKQQKPNKMDKKQLQKYFYQSADYKKLKHI